MDATNHTDESLPADDLGGQCSFYGIEDPAWVALILRRLKAGDVITVTRAGDLLIMDG